MNHNRELYPSQQFASAQDKSFKSLLRALDADEAEPLSCAECRKHLAGFYHLVQEGVTLPAAYQVVAAHLINCPDCAAEYDALQAVMVELEAGTMPEPAAPPTFDLSFLPPSRRKPELPPTSLWQRSAVKNFWILLAELHVHLLASGGAAFGPLPAPLVPTLAPAAAFRSEPPGSQPQVLVLPAPDAQLSVHLAVGPMIADNAVVMVKLLAMPSEQPLVDTLISLRNAQRQLLMGLTTGPDGTAIFEQLALGRYFIQVRYEQHVWEIPLVIVAGAPTA